MGGMSRTKGAVGERAAAEILRPVFPTAARRAAGEESQERRGVDLKNTPGFAVQVNVAKAPAPLRKFREVAGALGPGERPLVLFREQSRSAAGQPWLACLKAEDLVALLVAVERTSHVPCLSDVTFNGPRVICPVTNPCASCRARLVLGVARAGARELAP